MDDHMFRDTAGTRVSINDRVKLTDMQGRRLGDPDGDARRYLLDLEGVVIALDEIGDDGHPKGENRLWVRLDGDQAVTKVHPGRVTIIAAKG